jgi:predicted enzyme related to lactoylglutathione lyase
MNLGAARIFVRNVAEAKSFYADRLGLTLESCRADHGVCIFDTGNTKLIIEAVAPDAPADDQALVGRFTGLSFPVEDIVSKYQQLRSLGVEFSGTPEKQYWGGWLVTFKDPAGNGLQLVQPPV